MSLSHLHHTGISYTVNATHAVFQKQGRKAIQCHCLSLHTYCLWVGERSEAVVVLLACNKYIMAQLNRTDNVI